MLELKKINKSYQTGDFIQHALKDVSLKFRKNEFVAILGPSGSGKTTLLNMIGGLDRYDSGDIIINQKSTKKFKDQDWDAYRNHSIGFIFQNYNLISHIDILSNVEMGMTLSGISPSQRRKKALEVLKRVGLEDHIHKLPNQLSGGQMQRVAIARALSNNPDIILADEPTGALDSDTSKQIMDLIQEVASDKLVIMVTHNAELAKEYASRIVEMKDGMIESDSHPMKEIDDNETYSLKKTAMSFFTAIYLSVHNIKTKKGRTLLTSFAASIGIIGIALILSLSNGFAIQINTFEQTTLSSLPVIIENGGSSIEDTQKEASSALEKGSFPEDNYVTTLKETETEVHQNIITKDYMDYIENIDEQYISGISYNYSMTMNLLQKVNNQVQSENIAMGVIPHQADSNAKTVIDTEFDLLAGSMPSSKEEILLEVDQNNQVSSAILKALNLPTNENVSFDTILNSTIKVALNDDYYVASGNIYYPTTNLKALYDNPNTLTLKVSGIVRIKENYPSASSTSFLYYTNDLANYLLDKNSNSAIVKKQKDVNYNVLTGTLLDNDKDKDTILGLLGGESIPYIIQIFPKNFDSKTSITNYLDSYNNNKEEKDKVYYIDEAQVMSSLSSNIMNGITIVLVAFSSISLIVSSIMIGIITYISVLERTKEIGILRSLGARKKDISRVFNAETFIIGVTSGVLGIFIAWLLTFPVNQLLKSLTSLDNVAILNPMHAIILILISVTLTMIGGFIPAKMASKKDPVEALRTE